MRGIPHRSTAARVAARLFALALPALLAGCASAPPPGPGEHVVHVTTKGFEPKVTEVAKGQPVVLLVTRDTDKTCATDMVFEGTGKQWDLPLHRTVRVELPALTGDTLRYACGMDMYSGVIVAK